MNKKTEYKCRVPDCPNKAMKSYTDCFVDMKYEASYPNMVTHHELGIFCADHFVEIRQFVAKLLKEDENMERAA